MFFVAPIACKLSAIEYSYNQTEKARLKSKMANHAA